MKNTQVEPDDIKWGSGMAIDVTSTTTEIIITGLKLNAAGTIHGLAIVPSRQVYYSTQDSLQSAIRYLIEEPNAPLLHRERHLASAYGQQDCLTSQDDELTVYCSGASLPAPDRSRDDYDFFNSPPLPSSYQVVREADGSYFKGDGVASVAYTVIFTELI